MIESLWAQPMLFDQLDPPPLRCELTLCLTSEGWSVGVWIYDLVTGEPCAGAAELRKPQQDHVEAAFVALQTLLETADDLRGPSPF